VTSRFDTPSRAIAAGAVLALAAMTGGGVSANQSEQPPALQLGDSVSMPIRAINAGHESSVAFFLPENDLLPESVAYDVKDGSFYVGSTRKGKVVRRDAKGNVTDFITPRQDGLGMVIGIKIHPMRRILWVCSFTGPGLEGLSPDEPRTGGVFAFNLDTGRLINKWVMSDKDKVNAFNDLVVTRGNDVYATHMVAEPSVYRIAREGGKLELFAKPDGLREPNGITISPDEKTLYVAGADGIIAIDVATRTSRPVPAPENENTGGIDGLYFYGESLIGIRDESINRYHLDDKWSRIVTTEVLEAHHPLMHIATTGVIVGSDFFYIANSCVDAVKPDGGLVTDQLTEPAILKLALR